MKEQTKREKITMTNKELKYYEHCYKSGVKEERKRWLDGKACHHCGEDIEELSMTNDTCNKCWEEG